MEKSWITCFLEICFEPIIDLYNWVAEVVRRGLGRGGQPRLLARRRAGVVRRIRLRLRLGEQADGGLVERRAGRRESIRCPWTPRHKADAGGDAHIRVRRVAARG